MEGLCQRVLNLQQFHLPPLPNNLQFGCHPRFASISKHTDQWVVSKLEINNESHREKITETRIGLFASMMHPQSTIDEGKLIFATKHIWIMFMVDDFLESSTKKEFPEVKNLISEMARGAFNFHKPLRFSLDHPCLSLYNEFAAELREAFSPPLFSRYLRVLGNYLNAVEHEVDHTLVESSVPSPEIYSRMRRETGFMEVMAGMMTEFCLGLELEQEDIESHEFRRLITCISNHIVMVNDMLSFRKELYEKPDSFSHNWLSVLLHHSPPSTSFQDVVYKLRDMIQEEEDEILSLQERLIIRATEKNDEHLLMFARAFPMCAAGHLRWCYITFRYHGCGNNLLTGESFHGTWLLHPRATIIVPVKNKSDPQHPYLVSA